MSGQGHSAAQQLSVVTFNVRGIMDRWEERAPHAAAALAAVDADVVAFQEVLTGECSSE
jgi:endonuclease/exonuclease/phosphatase family metal-dependent hydrolase